MEKVLEKAHVAESPHVAMYSYKTENADCALWTRVMAILHSCSKNWIM